MPTSTPTPLRTPAPSPALGQPGRSHPGPRRPRLAPAAPAGGGRSGERRAVLRRLQVAAPAQLRLRIVRELRAAAAR